MARKELAGRETHCLEVTAQVETVCDRGRINIQSFMRGTKARFPTARTGRDERGREEQ